MAAANFDYKDRLFVVKDEGDDSYEILTANIRDLMNKLAKQAGSKDSEITLVVGAEDKPFPAKGENSNSHYGNQHGYILAEAAFMDLYIAVRLNVIVRTGYYSDANIDYQLALEVEGTTHLETDGAEAVFDNLDLEEMDEMGYSEDVIEASKPQLDELLNNMRKIVLEGFEVITGELATEYKNNATFSSGETIYGTVERMVIPFEVLDYSA